LAFAIPESVERRFYNPLISTQYDVLAPLGSIAPRPEPVNSPKRRKLNLAALERLWFWVDEHGHVYHFAGTRDFGNTKRGAYMCEADA
jgi:hypothetical protein